MLSFQSTRPVRDATPHDFGHPAVRRVSIHASRTGRDKHLDPYQQMVRVFQSTRPVRDATLKRDLNGFVSPFQSTRPVRDATHRADYAQALLIVSIHASRTGRDCPRGTFAYRASSFNPRVPYGTRPLATGKFLSVNQVSIHASRTGRDKTKTMRLTLHFCFNPRVPYGTRHQI